MCIRDRSLIRDIVAAERTSSSPGNSSEMKATHPEVPIFATKRPSLLSSPRIELQLSVETTTLKNSIEIGKQTNSSKLKVKLPEVQNTEPSLIEDIFTAERTSLSPGNSSDFKATFSEVPIFATERPNLLSSAGIEPKI